MEMLGGGVVVVVVIFYAWWPLPWYSAVLWLIQTCYIKFVSYGLEHVEILLCLSDCT